MSNNQQLSIKSNSDLLKGRFANAVSVSTNDNEVVIDFAFLFSTSEKHPSGEMVARIIATPKFAAQLAKTITESSAKLKQKNNDHKK